MCLMLGFVQWPGGTTRNSAVVAVISRSQLRPANFSELVGLRAFKTDVHCLAAACPQIWDLA